MFRKSCKKDLEEEFGGFKANVDRFVIDFLGFGKVENIKIVKKH